MACPIAPLDSSQTVSIGDKKMHIMLIVCALCSIEVVVLQEAFLMLPQMSSVGGPVGMQCTVQQQRLRAAVI